MLKIDKVSKPITGNRTVHNKAMSSYERIIAEVESPKVDKPTTRYAKNEGAFSLK
jgi:hypothetical protein